MDEELERLRRQVAQDFDEAAVTRLVSALLRAGARSEAFALLSTSDPYGNDTSVQARLTTLLADGEYLSELEVRHYPAPSRSRVNRLAFDLEGARLVSGHASGEIWLVPLEGDPVVVGRHRTGIWGLSFARDGRSVAATSRKQGIHWDLARGSRRDDPLPFVNRIQTSRALPAILHAEGLDFMRGTKVLPLVGPSSALDLGLPSPLVDPATRVEAILQLSPNPAAGCLVIGPRGGYAFLAAGVVTGFDPQGRRLFAVDDERLYLPRSDPSSAAALAPLGRALAFGSPPGGKGARVVLGTDPPRVEPVLAKERVTALAFSPCGSRLAMGTTRGDVFVIGLIPSCSLSSAAQPSPPSTPAPAESGPHSGGVALLRTIRVDGSRGRDWIKGELALDASSVWFLPTRAYGISPEDRKVFFSCACRYDLATGERLRCPLLVRREDGVCWDDDESQRAFAIRPTQPTEGPVEGPPWPPPKPRRVKRAPINARLELETRKVFPAPSTGWIAAQVKQRPRELWVLDADGDATPTRLGFDADVLRVAWSPDGATLAVLTKFSQVCLYRVPATAGDRP